MFDFKFAQLCFHDSRIESVEREAQTLTVRLDRGLIHRGERHEVLQNVSLVFMGVEEERSVVWLDDKAGRPHSRPEFPIVEVTEISMTDDVFKFEGFCREREWCEWWIRARDFRLIKF
ncbi:MAG: hypothetical protein KC800_11620 [Candidatus Eremiobacteraeota bacterium]|nr:hypothetical protein [Candidatus Eremiobacteraeota bacterium]